MRGFELIPRKGFCDLCASKGKILDTDMKVIGFFVKSSQQITTLDVCKEHLEEALEKLKHAK